MKVTITVFVMLVMCRVTHAQNSNTSTSKKMSAGLKLGIAVSNVRVKESPGTAVPDVSSKTGIYAAGFIRLALDKWVAFQPEVVLSGKGWKQDNTYVTNATYLEIPLNLIYTATSTKGTFFAGGGPAPAFFIGETLFYNGFNPRKQVDIGANILIGYEIPIGASINFHYTRGFVNVVNDDNGNSIFNRTFGLSIGYIF